MSDLTLEEKQRYAEYHAREKVAEKHFFDEAGPFYPRGFSINYRNPGHWDVYADQHPGKIKAFLSLDSHNQTSGKDGGRERAFRIRGEPDDVWVMDERWNPHRPHPRETMKFRSIQAAMLWVSEELMQEDAKP